MEEESLKQGEARVKFTSSFEGKLTKVFQEKPNLGETYHEKATAMMSILEIMEKSGAAPVCFDGKVAGNAACILKDDTQEYLLVSKSGKTTKMSIDSDFCIVSSFDFDAWASKFWGAEEEVLPTSDTPLHFTALYAYKKFGWPEVPGASLHGHALASEEEAERAGIPISPEETLFSTKEDSDALLALMEKYPYPEHKVFVRKNHGFFILGKDLAETNETFKERILPYMS